MYIGANSTILAGVTIGDFNVIDASPLVKKLSKPNSLLTGVPVTVKATISVPQAKKNWGYK